MAGLFPGGRNKSQERRSTTDRSPRAGPACSSAPEEGSPMRGIRLGGPGLLLALWVSAAPAEEVRWRPAAGACPVAVQAGAPCPDTAVVSLGRPMTIGAASTPVADATPVAALGRPLPAAAGTAAQPGAPGLLDPGLFP